VRAIAMRGMYESSFYFPQDPTNQSLAHGALNIKKYIKNLIKKK
jgi:hypothetical protein